MKFTIEEASKMLANRIHQPHYIKWVIEKVVENEVDIALAGAAMREAEDTGTVGWEDVKARLGGVK